MPLTASESPMRFGLLRDLWTLSDEKELDIMAAGIAFYGFLALFPPWRR